MEEERKNADPVHLDDVNIGGDSIGVKVIHNPLDLEIDKRKSDADDADVGCWNCYSCLRMLTQSHLGPINLLGPESSSLSSRRMHVHMYANIKRLGANHFLSRWHW